MMHSPVRRPSIRYVVLLLCIVIGVVACTSVRKPLDEATAVSLVGTAIVKQHLSALPLQCLALSPAAEAPSGYLITVREVHSKECGGDPDTSPRLFSIKIDGAGKSLILKQVDGTDVPIPSSK